MSGNYEPDVIDQLGFVVGLGALGAAAYHTVQHVNTVKHAQKSAASIPRRDIRGTHKAYVPKPGHTGLDLGLNILPVQKLKPNFFTDMNAVRNDIGSDYHGIINFIENQLGNQKYGVSYVKANNGIHEFSVNMLDANGNPVKKLKIGSLSKDGLFSTSIDNIAKNMSGKFEIDGIKMTRDEAIFYAKKQAMAANADLNAVDTFFNNMSDYIGPEGDYTNRGDYQVGRHKVTPVVIENGIPSHMSIENANKMGKHSGLLNSDDIMRGAYFEDGIDDVVGSIGGDKPLRQLVKKNTNFYIDGQLAKLNSKYTINPISSAKGYASNSMAALPALRMSDTSIFDRLLASGKFTNGVAIPGINNTEAYYHSFGDGLKVGIDKSYNFKVNKIAEGKALNAHMSNITVGALASGTIDVNSLPADIRKAIHDLHIDVGGVTSKSTLHAQTAKINKALRSNDPNLKNSAIALRKYVLKNLSDTDQFGEVIEHMGKNYYNNKGYRLKGVLSIDEYGIKKMANTNRSLTEYLKNIKLTTDLDGNTSINLFSEVIGDASKFHGTIKATKTGELTTEAASEIFKYVMGAQYYEHMTGNKASMDNIDDFVTTIDDFLKNNKDVSEEINRAIIENDGKFIFAHSLDYAKGQDPNITRQQMYNDFKYFQAGGDKKADRVLQMLENENTPMSDILEEIKTNYTTDFQRAKMAMYMEGTEGSTGFTHLMTGAAPTVQYHGVGNPSRISAEVIDFLKSSHGSQIADELENVHLSESKYNLSQAIENLMPGVASDDFKLSKNTSLIDMEHLGRKYDIDGKMVSGIDAVKSTDRTLAVKWLEEFNKHNLENPIKMSAGTSYQVDISKSIASEKTGIKYLPFMSNMDDSLLSSSMDSVFEGTPIRGKLNRDISGLLNLAMYGSADEARYSEIGDSYKNTVAELVTSKELGYKGTKDARKSINLEIQQQNILADDYIDQLTEQFKAAGKDPGELRAIYEKHGAVFDDKGHISNRMAIVNDKTFAKLKKISGDSGPFLENLIDTRAPGTTPHSVGASKYANAESLFMDIGKALGKRNQYRDWSKRIFLDDRAYMSKLAIGEMAADFDLDIASIFAVKTPESRKNIESLIQAYAGDFYQESYATGGKAWKEQAKAKAWKDMFESRLELEKYAPGSAEHAAALKRLNKMFTGAAALESVGSITNALTPFGGEGNMALLANDMDDAGISTQRMFTKVMREKAITGGQYDTEGLARMNDILRSGDSDQVADLFSDVFNSLSDDMEVKGKIKSYIDKNPGFFKKVAKQGTAIRDSAMWQDAMKAINRANPSIDDAINMVKQNIDSVATGKQKFTAANIAQEASVAANVSRKSKSHSMVEMVSEGLKSAWNNKLIRYAGLGALAASVLLKPSDAAIRQQEVREESRPKKKFIPKPGEGIDPGVGVVGRAAPQGYKLSLRGDLPVGMSSDEFRTGLANLGMDATGSIVNRQPMMDAQYLDQLREEHRINYWK